MTFSKIGRMLTALVASAALGLGMTACGGGTIGYMWVLGTFYNQISGFLIDDFTGNLTAIAHSPFPSGGTDPVSIVVKPGGRYVYVINSGSGATGTPGTASFNSPGAAIAEFSVGTGGILTFEQTFFSQGVNPVWATFDSTGNYLYVLDKYSPDYGSVINGSTSTNGSITAFAVDGSTGRLTLVTNNAILTNGKAQTYFDVGSSPTMTTVGSGGCLFTLSANSIYPYVVNSSSGQLTVATTGATVISAPTGGVTPNFTSINTRQRQLGQRFHVPHRQRQQFHLHPPGRQLQLLAHSGCRQPNDQRAGYKQSGLFHHQQQRQVPLCHEL